MPNRIAELFIEGLNVLESNREAEALVRLFAEDAETGNVIAPEKFHGPEGAREFWTKYRDTFESVKSTFRNKIAEENRVALEWETAGTSAQGARVEYSGVSILEIAGDKIHRFRAYFDPSALGRQIEPSIS